MRSERPDSPTSRRCFGEREREGAISPKGAQDHTTHRQWKASLARVSPVEDRMPSIGKNSTDTCAATLVLRSVRGSHPEIGEISTDREKHGGFSLRGGAPGPTSDRGPLALSVERRPRTSEHGGAPPCAYCPAYDWQGILGAPPRCQTLGTQLPIHCRDTPRDEQLSKITSLPVAFPRRDWGRLCPHSPVGLACQASCHAMPCPSSTIQRACLLACVQTFCRVTCLIGLSRPACRWSSGLQSAGCVPCLGSICRALLRAPVAATAAPALRRLCLLSPPSRARVHAHAMQTGGRVAVGRTD